MSDPSMFRFSHTAGTLRPQPRKSNGFNGPVDMALSRDGILHVLSRAGSKKAALVKRITKLTIAGEFVAVCDFGATVSGDDMMQWPASIALDSEGQMYVSDEALQRVSVLDSEGGFLRKWGVKGKGDGEFNRPSGLAFDKDENLLVVDGLNDRVQKYTKDGEYLGGWGRRGSGDGEFYMPWGITVDHAGDVYVADWRNDRIQKFDTDGNHLASFGSSGDGDGQFHRPSWVAVDRDGDIYVTDWGNERVQVLGPDGSFITKFRGDSGIVDELSILSKIYYQMDAFKSQYVEGRKAQESLERDPPNFESPREESGSIQRYFWAPTSVKVDDEGRIYIVDTLRARIQVYQKETGPAGGRVQDEKAAVNA